MGLLRLKDIDPASTDGLHDKEKIIKKTQHYLEKMNERMHLMYAESRHSLLIILQGIDASGKDGTIQHIFSGCNPQGVRVSSFKQPSEEELQHDFLWRCHRVTPASGMTCIFNRSYYEEVTTVMVHPELLFNQRLPQHALKDKQLFEKRYEQINQFEKMLTQNGTIVLKFFLHISKHEQKQRFEERIKDPTKNWKFSKADTRERKYWDEYMTAFQKMLDKTHTQEAPWTVIPADKKWYRNYLVSKIIVDTLAAVPMKYPHLK